MYTKVLTKTYKYTNLWIKSQDSKHIIFFFKPEIPLHKTSMCQVRIKLFLYSSKEINKDKNKKKVCEVTGKFVKQKARLSF